MTLLSRERGLIHFPNCRYKNDFSIDKQPSQCCLITKCYSTFHSNEYELFVKE